MPDFALENIDMILNGHIVTGWSDDADALSLPNIDLASVVRGADGGMVSTSTGDKGGPVILKLRPNSPSTSFFMNAVEAQLNGGAVSWNGIIRDGQNNTVVTLVNGVLTNAPLGQTMGKGETPSREFTIEFEKVTPSYLAAGFI